MLIGRHFPLPFYLMFQFQERLGFPPAPRNLRAFTHSLPPLRPRRRPERHIWKGVFDLPIIVICAAGYLLSLGYQLPLGASNGILLGPKSRCTIVVCAVLAMIISQRY